jgi:hypothetical protein
MFMARTILRSFALAAVLLVLTASQGAARLEGTATELKSIPPFVKRLFVPLVAGTSNQFSISDRRFDEVLEAPRGFDLSIRNGVLHVAAPAGDAWGYARVRSGKRELTLTLMNMVSYSSVKNGILDGYRIGKYAKSPLRGLASYALPRGFIRMTRESRDAWVSDHYRLRDFQCKLDGSTKFLLLRPEALLKLELLQQDLVHYLGLKFGRFTIMSGFRTPYYNALIGNQTIYSRHLYGDAMDIYIDSNADGNMDDVNGDGRIDRKDALVLLQAAERIDRSPQWSWLKGGAGIYNANRAHGPYLHIDTRGYVARWGL